MYWILGIAFLVTVSTAPLDRRALGITYTGKPLVYYILTADPSTLPLLTLPYATYRAKSYDSQKDVYVFANIRFAAPPIGPLRWAEPADPVVEDGIQDGSSGGTCFQSTSFQVLQLFSTGLGAV